MKNPNVRYNDRELLQLLQKVAIDKMVKPTQRSITADETLPTHHTYIKRFGNIKEVMNLACIDEMVNSLHYHNLLMSIIKDLHVDKIEEFVQVGNITVNAVISSGDRKWFIDIVLIDGIPADILDKNAKFRSNAMHSYISDKKHYIQMASIDDIINESNKLREEF